MDLTLERWDRMNPAERDSAARRIAAGLPDGFAFRSIRTFSLGEQRHEVAMFDFEGACFALIPGGPVRLGYDAGRAWEPTPEELESWQGTAEAHGIDRSIREHIAETTLRPRIADLHPFLLEAEAGEVGWEPVPPDDAEVREILKELGSRASTVEVSRGDSSIRVQRAADGSIRAQRSLTLTHAQLAEGLGAVGFRFPTSDEWEYACGADAGTLFRWGDHAPCDRYPTDVSPEEAAWRRRWALSGGKLEPPEGGFRPDWDEHRRPNALGIRIATDPYKSELVSEPDLTRGGDGGCTICGGSGFFAGWLTLATAYFEEDSCRRDPTEAVIPGYTVARRALPLV